MGPFRKLSMENKENIIKLSPESKENITKLSPKPGFSNRKLKLSKEDKENIVYLSTNPSFSQKKVAKKYGITHGYVSMILKQNKKVGYSNFL